jgi:hypothetical protein
MQADWAEYAIPAGVMTFRNVTMDFVEEGAPTANSMRTASRRNVSIADAPTVPEAVGVSTRRTVEATRSVDPSSPARTTVYAASSDNVIPKVAIARNLATSPHGGTVNTAVIRQSASDTTAISHRSDRSDRAASLTDNAEQLNTRPDRHAVQGCAEDWMGTVVRMATACPAIAEAESAFYLASTLAKLVNKVISAVVEVALLARAAPLEIAAGPIVNAYLRTVSNPSASGHASQSAILVNLLTSALLGHVLPVNAAASERPALQSLTVEALDIAKTVWREDATRTNV